MTPDPIKSCKNLPTSFDLTAVKAASKVANAIFLALKAFKDPTPLVSINDATKT